MKETHILGLISFILSGLSFMLVHAHILLIRIGTFLLINKADDLMIERFRTLLLYVSTCLFILPAVALGLSLYIIKRRPLWMGVLTSGCAIFAYLYFMVNFV